MDIIKLLLQVQPENRPNCGIIIFNNLNKNNLIKIFYY